MKFECIECALCCKHLDRALDRAKNPPWMQKAIDEFPWKPDATGACEKLDGNRCSVYEDRPLLCNLERAHKELNMNMTKAEWFTMNAQGCNILLKEANVDIRVSIDYREER